MAVGAEKLPLADDNWAINEFTGELLKAQGIVKFTLTREPAHKALADTELKFIMSLFTVDVILFDVAGLVPVLEHKLDVITHLTASELKR